MSNKKENDGVLSSAVVISVGQMKERMTGKKKHSPIRSMMSFPSLGEVLVAKELDLEYVKRRDYFQQLFAADQTRVLVEQGSANNVAVAVHVVGGRKLDKVVLVTLNPNAAKLEDQAKQEIRYFIDKETHAIYGPKSTSAANPKQFYGFLPDVDAWDWSGRWGVPKDLDENGVSIKANVKIVGKYDLYTHYETLTASEKRKATAKA